MPKRAPSRRTPAAKKSEDAAADRLAPSGLLLAHDHFALAYAALELISPGAPGNGSKAYGKVSPDSSLKTAQNQATTLLRRPDVKARINALLLDAQGAEHVVRAGVFIDDLLLEAAAYAREQRDAATLGRLVELMDRGRLGGPKLVKVSGTRREDRNPFHGKSPAQIREMLAEARGVIDKADHDHGSPAGDAPEAGTRDRRGDPLH